MIDVRTAVRRAAAEELRARVRAFAEREMASSGADAHCDAWMTSYSAEFSRALGARGWAGMTIPAEYGGPGRTSMERYVVIEELLAAGAPVALHWFADRQVGPALLRHGSPAQRRRYLPGIARGECYFAIGMSEPDSGSDLAAVRTRARRDGGGWRLEGAKTWSSHAHLAHHMLVLARTDPAEDRRAGLSQFLVDLRLDGVQIRPITTQDGRRHFNEVVFDGVRLDDGCLLGTRGQGWSQVMAELALERSGPERFLSTMPLLRCLLRRTEARPKELGVLLAELRSIRAMSQSVAEALGRGETPTVAAAVVKDLGTRFEGKVVELARDLLPVVPDLASGDEYARLLAEAVVHSPDRTLRGGTNEILRGIVARTAAGA
ncbi:acyl-CoA dehydrogenase family protein [Acrocarpospora macrocephala]|uniref:Acyl-CoA dehydrogenase n=1 Tax=Acrocarpospora macrocephala TaxID=150177 RepID=A0A5M3WQH6_9ACTN|nr:acyl-CoA dehydrogenase family protein [Acrocarpospora macrocephala]GES11545.1 acyl-CoA dehydrogenase [Acrocarpospora macrocephala]